MVTELKKGDILLLENLRFHRAEEFPDEDPSFSHTLASYGDYYVNDALVLPIENIALPMLFLLFFPQKLPQDFLWKKKSKV